MIHPFIRSDHSGQCEWFLSWASIGIHLHIKWGFNQSVLYRISLPVIALIIKLKRISQK